MSRYLLSLLRHHVGPGRTLHLLTLLAVALGVASAVCIQILNQNAIGAFAGSVRAISGEADLTVFGRIEGLDEDLLARVLAHESVRAAWPLYRTDVALGGGGTAFLEVVGFDLMSPRALPWHDDEWEVAAALAEPGWVAVSPHLAAEMGWTRGQRIEVGVGDRIVTLSIGALVDFQRISPTASRRLAVMDIAQAQDLLGTTGRISQIDVAVRDEVPPASAARGLEAHLGPSVRVVTPQQREQEAAGLLAAFRFNLTALSLVSLLVGLFLVHGSTQASLVRRRAEFGVLRCLGAGRGRIIGLILGEVAALGLAGVAVGLPVGYLAAAANVDFVSRTLTNIYLLHEIETLELSVWVYVLGATVGIGGALAGAILPALDISRESPRALLAAYTLHERTAGWAPRLFLLGVSLAGAAGVWYILLAGTWRPAGFMLGLLLLGALSLATPLIVREACRRTSIRGFGLAYSLRTLSSRLQTTSFAVISLAMAVSMMVGITIMISSFRETLDAWIHATIRADIYVTSASLRRGDGEAALGRRLIADLAAHPAVKSVDRLRRTRVFAGERRITLAAVDMALPGGESRFVMLSGPARQAFRRVREEGSVLISEPLARRTGLEVGGRLRLFGPQGEESFTVAGVFADYGSEAGAAFIDLDRFEAFLGPGDPVSVALYLKSGHSTETVIDDLKRRHAGLPLRLRSNRRLRQEILALFDQTFAVTGIVQLMSLLIAAAGVTLSLLVMARHRISETALYRALGARRRQIFHIFLAKGVSMGLFGVGIGSLGGFVLAVILVHAINPAYFGWTLRLHWPWTLLARQALTVLAASALAAVVPALQAGASPATEISRENVA